jgi:hypothetical protein
MIRIWVNEHGSKREFVLVITCIFLIFRKGSFMKLLQQLSRSSRTRRPRFKSKQEFIPIMRRCTENKSSKAAASACAEWIDRIDSSCRWRGDNSCGDNSCCDDRYDAKLVFILRNDASPKLIRHRFVKILISGRTALVAGIIRNYMLTNYRLKVNDSITDRNRG